MDQVICVFGDSVALGHHDPERGGWAGRLTRQLALSSDVIYNLSISGETTAGILKRFKVEAGARQPDIIIFAVGINDASLRRSGRDFYLKPDQFKKNLIKLISQARGLTEQIIFIGLNRVDENRTRPILWNTDAVYQNINIEKYNSIIKDICRAEKLQFIEIYDLLEDKDLADGLHPNQLGQEKIYQQIKKYLKHNNIGSG